MFAQINYIQVLIELAIGVRKTLKFFPLENSVIYRSWYSNFTYVLEYRQILVKTFPFKSILNS